MGGKILFLILNGNTIQPVLPFLARLFFEGKKKTRCYRYGACIVFVTVVVVCVQNIKIITGKCL